MCWICCGLELIWAICSSRLGHSHNTIINSALHFAYYAAFPWSLSSWSPCIIYMVSISQKISIFWLTFKSFIVDINGVGIWWEVFMLYYTSLIHELPLKWVKRFLLTSVAAGLSSHCSFIQYVIVFVWQNKNTRYSLQLLTPLNVHFNIIKNHLPGPEIDDRIHWNWRSTGTLSLY